jgi:hypothetical protein
MSKDPTVPTPADEIVALAHASGCPIGGHIALWLLGQKLVRKIGEPRINEYGRRVFALEITAKGQQLLDDVAAGRVPVRAEGGA